MFVYMVPVFRCIRWHCRGGSRLTSPLERVMSAWRNVDGEPTVFINAVNVTVNVLLLRNIMNAFGMFPALNAGSP